MQRAVFTVSCWTFGRRSFLSHVALLALACAAIPSTARGAAPSAPAALPRAHDEVWLVSDRSLGCSAVSAGAANLQYWRYQPDRGWQASDSATFLAADDPATMTHIWIHGNRISYSYAFQVGWTAYAALVRQAGAGARPLRFVIWSWPSDRIDGTQRQDVRVKAARTGPSGLHLARFIDALPADLPVSVSAYSFGARIITGALHVMNGGAVDGRRLAMHSAATRPRLDVVLIAAAFDNDWILPGHCYGRALGMMGHLLLVTNSCDDVLDRYHWIYGLRSCAQALGATGLVGGNLLGADRAKITQFDACCFVGPEHDWSHYFASPAVVARMVPLVFGSQSPSQAPAAAPVSGATPSGGPTPSDGAAAVSGASASDVVTVSAVAD